LCICCWFRVVTFLFLGKGGAVILHSYYSDAEGPADFGSVVFIPEVDGTGDAGSGLNISVDAETPLVAFMENLQIWRLFLSCRSIRIFGESALRLKEFYCKRRF